MKHNPTIRDIDLAWEAVNALGGTPVCAHDHVYNLAISDALKVIENLGGSDPIGRRNARKPTPASPVMRGEGVLPDSPRCPCMRCLIERGNYLPPPNDRIPPHRTRLVVCATCGNKRCPHATDHRLVCTESNAPGQAGSYYGGGHTLPLARLDALNGDDPEAA